MSPFICRRNIQISKNFHARSPTWCQRARLELPDHMTEFSLQIGSIGVLQYHEHVLHVNNPITLSVELTKGLYNTSVEMLSFFQILWYKYQVKVSHK